MASKKCGRQLFLTSSENSCIFGMYLYRLWHVRYRSYGHDILIPLLMVLFKKIKFIQQAYNRSLPYIIQNSSFYSLLSLWNLQCHLDIQNAFCLALWHGTSLNDKTLQDIFTTVTTKETTTAETTATTTATTATFSMSFVFMRGFFAILLGS